MVISRKNRMYFKLSEKRDENSRAAGACAVPFAVTGGLDIFFSSNHNIYRSLHGLCFWASDPLIDKHYSNLSIKGSEAKKQRPYELL